MRAKSLSSMIVGFKSKTTRKINEIRKTPGAKLWQRNYYEHIIRSEKELNQIREYILNNPLKWELDDEHPKNLL
jgi:REP element-mobilizing transposase RayT